MSIFRYLCGVINPSCFMLSSLIEYFQRKIEKRRIRKTFKEYGFKVSTHQLPTDGPVQFATWENPLEAEKGISQGQVNFYRKLIAKGQLAIDIGAHIGDTTVPMGLAAGTEGLVLGFDPNPYVYNVLNANTRLNPDKVRIEAHNMAITETDGEFFYASSDATFNNGGISTTAQSRHGKYNLSTKVPGVNLQRFLAERYPEWLPKLSLIKVDTEGYDKEILNNIYGLLESQRPYVIAECFKKLTTDERYALFGLFDRLNYQVYHVEDFEEHAALTPLAGREDMKNWKHFDMLAIPKESPLSL